MKYKKGGKRAGCPPVYGGQLPSLSQVSETVLFFCESKVLKIFGMIVLQRLNSLEKKWLFTDSEVISCVMWRYCCSFSLNAGQNIFTGEGLFGFLKKTKQTLFNEKLKLNTQTAHSVGAASAFQRNAIRMAFR